MFCTLISTKLPILKKFCKSDSEKFQLMRFSRSFCLLLTEFFLSIRTEISARSLPLCQILQIFTLNFLRYFRSKYKFCKIFACTRSLDLHLREPGVLARARPISGPGRARQETISSHLKYQESSFRTTPLHHYRHHHHHHRRPNRANIICKPKGSRANLFISTMSPPLLVVAHYTVI